MANAEQQGAQLKVTVIVNGKTAALMTNIATVTSDTADPNTANNSPPILTPVTNRGNGNKQ